MADGRGARIARMGAWGQLMGASPRQIAKRVYEREYRAQKRELVNEIKRRWRARNRELIAARRKAARAADPERFRRVERASRARRAA